MRRFSLVLGGAATVLAAACGDSGPTGNGAPVDITVSTIRNTLDTATATVTMDDTLTFTVRGDTVITGVPSGSHDFEVVTTLDYLPFIFSQTVSASQPVVAIPRPGTCRIITGDASFCQGRNFNYWAGHTYVVCPANDYGAFCSAITDPFFLGLTWPDTLPDAANAYLFHSKLLVGAVRDAVSGGGDDTLAMAFYGEGDYAPRERIHVVGSDSTLWRNVVWTDVRHLPLLGQDTTILRETDRPGENFGLEVAITAYLPPSEKNAVLFRFDIRNISATPEYRFFHPEEPAGGHTLRDVYLAPFFDPDIGGGYTANGASGLARSADTETRNDNATLFPAESLLVAYQQNFQVPAFSQKYRGAPGLFGVQLVQSPAGTAARGIILSDSLSPSDKILLTFSPPAREDTLYAYYSAGRGGAQLLRPSCTTYAEALVCAPENGNNVRMGFSVGPIATLAPNQSVSLTIAIVMAEPAAGSVTAGTVVRPQNDQLGSTSRTIYDIAADLRARAAQVRALRVP